MACVTTNNFSTMWDIPILILSAFDGAMKKVFISTLLLDLLFN